MLTRSGTLMLVRVCCGYSVEGLAKKCQMHQVFRQTTIMVVLLWMHHQHGKDSE